MKKHRLKALCIAGLALSVLTPTFAQAQYYEPIPSVYDSERVRPEDRRGVRDQGRHGHPHHHQPPRQERRHNHSDDDLAIGILGLTTGIIIGNALGDDRRYAPPPPPPPRYRPHRPHHRYEYVRAWSREWYRWCSARYRSFNPRTGFFIARDGVRQFCDANR